MNPAPLPSPAVPAPPRRSRASGFTLLEIAVALAVFTLGAAGLVECHALFNAQAARNRCEAAAHAVLRAKVAKVLTDPWDATVPVSCVATTGFVADVADPADPFDVGPSVVLLAASDSPLVGVVSGDLTRRTRVLESATPTVVVDLALTYVVRGRTYVASTSVARARDR